MTSSLVGSEMCIRDRAPPATPTRTGRRPQTRTHLDRPGWAVWMSPRAVSYTHLTLPTICSV
eukprot:5270442-Prorocentrum_lima.AAC.1